MSAEKEKAVLELVQKFVEFKEYIMGLQNVGQQLMHSLKSLDEGFMWAREAIFAGAGPEMVNAVGTVVEAIDPAATPVVEAVETIVDAVSSKA